MSIPMVLSPSWLLWALLTWHFILHCIEQLNKSPVPSLLYLGCLLITGLQFFTSPLLYGFMCCEGGLIGSPVVFWCGDWGQPFNQASLPMMHQSAVISKLRQLSAIERARLRERARERARERESESARARARERERAIGGRAVQSVSVRTGDYRPLFWHAPI